MSGQASPRIVLLMGPAAVGKTTVGQAVAERFGAAFIDADDLHPPTNVERMRHGEPLDDEARAPWLRAVNRAIAERAEARERVLVACSALKAAYRATLLDGLDDVAIVDLRADRATLDARLRDRTDHFMPASLLDSQLADLEPPADGDAIVVDASGDPATTVDRVIEAVLGRQGATLQLDPEPHR